MSTPPVIPVELQKVLGEPTPPPVPVQQQMILDKLPAWVAKTKPAIHKKARTSLESVAPWLAKAAKEHPQIIQALALEYALRHEYQSKVADLFAPLPALEEFAETLLVPAIKEHFGLDLDVHKSSLFTPKLWSDESSRQTLLKSAMQNFEQAHTQPGAMDDGRLKAYILGVNAQRPETEPEQGARKTVKITDVTHTRNISGPYQAYLLKAETLTLGEFVDSPEIPRHEPSGEGTRDAIKPEQLATLARKLDIGGEYQKKIDAVYTPKPVVGNTFPDIDGVLKNAELYAFRVHAHLAYLQQHISKSLYDSLLELTLSDAKVKRGVLQSDFVTNELPWYFDTFFKPALLAPFQFINWGTIVDPLVNPSGAMSCSFLALWERQLNGVVVFGRAPYTGPIALYMPGAPTPLKEYPSLAALKKALPALLNTFEMSKLRQLMPDRYSDELTQKLIAHLYPYKRTTASPLVYRTYDPDAVIPCTLNGFDAPFAEQMAEQKKACFKDSALFHAVPTAAEDELTVEKRIAYIKQKIIAVANVGAFFFEPLNVLMLAYNAYQLGHEIFDGLESLAIGDREQALSYLMDVGENVATIAALVAVGGGEFATPAVEHIPVETPSFIEELKPVEMPNGEKRLWHPDLAPFAHDTVLPAGLKPDEFGLYHHDGKTWMAVEDKVYSVKPTAINNEYRIEHPSDSDRYQPIARHNGAGTWLHEADKPLEWQGHTLVRRIGPTGAALSEARAKQVLQVSDTREAVLRATYSDNLPPPALFSDTLERFNLDEQVINDLPEANAATRATEFEARYQALSVSQSANATAITKAYPKLPSSVADEVLSHATPEELIELQAGKVPLRLSKEIRIYQQQVRLARAYEGLYLESVNNPDTDILILHSLPDLPGWSSDVRIEVHGKFFSGAQVDSIGAETAPIRKVLTRHANGYEAFDSEGHSLNGRDNLYAALLHALPDEQRVALGLPGVWDGPKLKLKIQQSHLSRPELRKALGMQPAKAGVKSPMRLAKGRIGYPLSGRGAISTYIHRDTLLDMIRWLELPRDTQSAEQVLSALEARGLSREQIHARLNELFTERTALQRSLDSWGEASSTLTDSETHEQSRTRIVAAIWEQ
jgi:hypothetical protein